MFDRKECGIPTIYEWNLRVKSEEDHIQRNKRFKSFTFQFNYY